MKDPMVRVFALARQAINDKPVPDADAQLRREHRITSAEQTYHDNESRCRALFQLILAELTSFPGRPTIALNQADVKTILEFPHDVH